MKKNILKSLKIDYRLLLMLLFLIIGAQLVLTVYSKQAFHSFLSNTQDWYQNFAEKRIANLTSTSLELLVETQMAQKNIDPVQKNRIIKSFDIIFSQHIMEKNAEEICLFIYDHDTFVQVNDGKTFFSVINEGKAIRSQNKRFSHAEELFNSIKDKLIHSERVQVVVENEKVFNIFVPFAPNGEFLGALYMKVVPNFSALSHEFTASYNKVSLIYVFLVSLGLVFIYFVFSITLKEKEKAQMLANEEHEMFIKEKMDREKENTFTRRIYHAYHKAEKIIGFINMDLEVMDTSNLSTLKRRVYKYTNFIGRVIYDMKYYDPPMHSIINPMFQTDINEVCRFIIENLFRQTCSSSKVYDFVQEYDPSLPKININEYVIWEIIEPLLQNSIIHNPAKHINISVRTKYEKLNNRIILTLSDNGKGIDPELLETDEGQVQKLFLENVSTKSRIGLQGGFGCYIAHSLAVKYCGWKMSAENVDPSGCQFIIEIPIN